MSGAVSITLPEHIVAFVESGVSITVGSRDARHVPSIVRALACRVLADRHTVRLWLSHAQSCQLRLDCAASNVITAVFSEVTTHRTWQIKGDDVSQRAPEPGDRALVDAHKAAFGYEVAQVGFDRAFTHNLMHTGDDDLVVVQFRAQSVFDQTPGPNAGQKLELLS